MDISEALLLQRMQRRSLRLVEPGRQLRLALSVLAVALFFALLFMLNTYGAFGRLTSATLWGAPIALREDIWAQADSYLRVSVALLIGFALAVAAVCVAHVHRLLGPVTALERHTRALERGDYSNRIALRDGDTVYSELALRLNSLAERLEQMERDGSAAGAGQPRARSPRPVAEREEPVLPFTIRV